MAKTSFNAPRRDMFLLPADELVLIEDERHPLYDPRVKLPVDEAMVLNIMAKGVLEPVIVAKDGDRALVVDGRRRVKAAKEASRRLAAQGMEQIRVPTIQRRGDDKDLYGVLVSANEHRRDDSPMERAKKASRMADMGMGEDQIALAFGVSTQSIGNWMKLLDTAAPVRRAVESGHIPAKAAARLSGLPKDEQVEALEGLLEDEKKTGKKVTAKKASKAAGKAEGRMRGKREIVKRLEEDKLPRDYRAALMWVLGEE